MDNLRWILLGIGLVIILGIYLYASLKSVRFRVPSLFGSSRRRPRRPAARDNEPGMEDNGSSPAEEFDALFLDEQDEAGGGASVSITRSQASAPVAEEQVFALFVTAPPGVPFRGPLLLNALDIARMTFGDMDIFHRVELVNGAERTLFYAANIREPGIFNPAAMEDFTTEGIAFFMQVGSAVDAVWAFEAMVEAARTLAESLGGTLCDSTRSALTKQTIGHMREAVVRSQLQQRMANTAS